MYVVNLNKNQFNLIIKIREVQNMCTSKITLQNDYALFFFRKSSRKHGYHIIYGVPGKSLRAFRRRYIICNNHQGNIPNRKLVRKM